MGENVMIDGFKSLADLRKEKEDLIDSFNREKDKLYFEKYKNRINELNRSINEMQIRGKEI